MKRLASSYAATYTFIYMAMGAFMPLIAQHLQKIGFTGSQIGIIVATGTIVSIFSSTFWGERYSKSTKKHQIVILLCSMTALICFLLAGILEYVVFIIAFGLLYFFQGPMVALMDSLTVEGKQNFGSIRIWGAVGFSIGIFIAGKAIDSFGTLSIFYIYISSFIIGGMILFVIMKKEKKANIVRVSRNKKNEKDLGYLFLLKNKYVRRFMLVTFFIGGINIANNTYFSFLYIDGGGTIAGVGIAMFLMVGSEIPFMASYNRLAQLVGIERLILISIIISGIRYFLFSLGLPWWMLICIFFMHGAVNGIVLIAFVRYVASLVTEKYKSLIISLYYIIGSNLSAIFAQVVGGWFLENIGIRGVYLFYAILNLFGIVLYIAFGMYKKQREENSAKIGD